MTIALIMAGGAGKRFWPLSRKDLPKQYLRIMSEKSMIRQTIDRLATKISYKDIYVVTTRHQKRLVEEHIPELPSENIILEPEGMNTAPAIALSALFLSRKYRADDKMFIQHSDHLIKDVNAFLSALDPAGKAAEENYLVTFGIKPSYPATGYGYIESGNNLGFGMSVKSFKEKPDVKTAEQFISKGNYYWNAGMFLWKINIIIEAYRKYLPKIFTLMEEISQRWNTDGTMADITDIYSRMPKIPVDIGIMEQSDKRIVIPVDYGWCDIGGWKAVYDISEKDENGNVFKCPNESIDTNNCYVNSHKLVTLAGVRDLLIVDTPDALLITGMDHSETVKDLVSALEKKKMNSVL